MHKDTLKSLTHLRLREAKFLLGGRFYSAAYYLAGYAVESALKVVVAGKFREDTIPLKRFVDNIHTHDLERLIREAGMDDDFLEAKKHLVFRTHWQTVAEWKPEIRYTILHPDETIAVPARWADGEPIFDGRSGYGCGSGNGAGSGDGSGGDNDAPLLFEEGKKVFDLLNAIEHKIHGILPWIKRFW
jgi:HEPN domain-containing protein